MSDNTLYLSERYCGHRPEFSELHHNAAPARGLWSLVNQSGLAAMQIDPAFGPKIPEVSGTLS